MKLGKVRLYDGFDSEWIDITEWLPYDEAKKVYNQKTKNGTRKTKFDDIDYYKLEVLESTVIDVTLANHFQKLYDKYYGHETQ